MMRATRLPSRVRMQVRVRTPTRHHVGMVIAAAPATQPRERLFFVDWLRIGAFGLLVLYHVGMVYVPWDFHVKHVPTYAALEPFMRLTNPWRMSLLFVISGLATGLMLGRTGLARERAKRLLLPLLFGMFVVVPPQAWFQVRDQWGYAGSYLEFLRLYLTGYHGFCKGSDCLALPTWNHLWFLPYLWFCTALLLIGVRVLPAVWLQRAATWLGRAAGWRLIVVPVLVLGALRVLLLPRFPESHALLGDWWAHATYGTLFLFGVLLARRRILLARLQDLRWPALLLAVAGWACITAALAFFTLGPGTPELQRLPLRLAFVTQQWCALVAALGFARQHLDHDHPWRAPLTEAVFPLYIVHQTIIIAGAVWLRPLALPAGVEAALLVALTFIGGFAAWRMARRIAWLRPWMGIGSRPGAVAAGQPAESTAPGSKPQA